ncbi:MAG: hypothetical protein JJU11_16535, partial [Candidatus Sumerlaeia bacterium]|nr:hypothetical protein [Candidatus Sumerlaeia bacterium]
MSSSSTPQKVPQARWIWRDQGEVAPANAFTWFRRVVDLDELPSRPTLHFAANSNARLLVNGHVLRRKVARYDERFPTAEVIEPGPWLRRGRNVILVLHHNWGPIVTFQRTGNRRAALWLESEWLWTDESWKWKVPPHLLPQGEQITGIAENAHRIRYGIHQDASHLEAIDPALGEYDDQSWRNATNVPGDAPVAVETPGQREYFFPVRSVLAGGTCESDAAEKSSPREISAALCGGRYVREPAMVTEAGNFIARGESTFQGRKGSSLYFTFDFQQPVHGYPVVDLKSSGSGVVMDLVYAEVARSQYSGKRQVREDGWLNPELVVGPGYTDRIHLAPGSNHIEVPDERTGRW